jgi:hypothetical protein
MSQPSFLPGPESPQPTWSSHGALLARAWAAGAGEVNCARIEVAAGRRSRAEDILPGAVQPPHDLLDLRQGGALLAVHETEKRGGGDPKLFREVLEGILSAPGGEKGRKALVEGGESAHPNDSGRDSIPYAELFVLLIPYKER